MRHSENTLAASQTFRALVEAPDADWPTIEALAIAQTASEAEARDRIIWDSFDAAVLDQPPQALIRQLQDAQLTRDSQSTYSVVGQMLLLLELPVPTAYRNSTKEAITHFANAVGAIITEMKQAITIEPAGLLDIANILRGPLEAYDPDDQPEQEVPGPDVPTWSVSLIITHWGAMS